MKQSILDIGDTKLAIYEEGEGETIIFLHGFPQNSHAWDNLIPKLNNYHLVAIDMRGVGNSDVCNHGQDKNNLAKDIKMIMDHLNIRLAIIVGHDMGGIVAQRFARNYQEYTKALICISTATETTSLSFFLQLKQLLTSWYIFFFQIPWLPEKIIPLFNDKLINKAFKHSDQETNDLELIAKAKEHCKPQLSPPRCTANFNFYRTISKDKKNIDVSHSIIFNMPVMWIQGEKDPFIPPIETVNFDQFKDIQLVKIKDKGHWLPDLASETLASYIKQFIGGLDDKSN